MESKTPEPPTPESGGRRRKRLNLPTRLTENLPELQEEYVPSMTNTASVDSIARKSRRRKSEKESVKEEDKTNLLETVAETSPALEKSINIFAHLKKEVHEFEDHSFSIFIHATDPLSFHSKGLNPFIRVHVMDYLRGCYFVDPDGKKTKAYFDTKVYSLNQSNNLTPSWEEELNTSKDYLSVVSENIILLFEILCSYKNNKADKIYRIAWAFFRPISVSGLANTEKKVRLQLYQSHDYLEDVNNVPQVYKLWKNQRSWKKYSSTLYATFFAKIPPSPGKINRHRSNMNMNMSLNILDNERDDSDSNSEIDADVVENDTVFNNPLVYEWERQRGEICKLPNKEFANMNTGIGGCKIAAFSSTGHYLAYSKIDDGNHCILVSDVLNRKPITTLHGSQGQINCIGWCKNDQFVLAASMDKTVRVWNFIATVPILLPILVFPHPSAVNCALFHPVIDKDMIVSCASDGKIRMWRPQWDSINTSVASTLNPDIVAQPVNIISASNAAINCIVYDAEGTKMYSADEEGRIKIFNPTILSLETKTYSSWEVYREIADPECEGIPINQLILYPSGRKLYAHCRDGVIRIIDLRLLRTVNRISIPKDKLYLEKNKARIYGRNLISTSCITPCGTYLLCGSDDGRVYSWHTDTNTLVAIYEGLSFSGTVNVVIYHPFENMVAFASNENSFDPLFLFKFDYSLPRVENLSGILVTEINSGLASANKVAETPISSPSPRLENFDRNTPSPFKPISEKKINAIKKYTIQDVLALLKQTDAISLKNSTELLLNAKSPTKPRNNRQYMSATNLVQANNEDSPKSSPIFSNHKTERLRPASKTVDFEKDRSGTKLSRVSLHQSMLSLKENIKAKGEPNDPFDLVDPLESKVAQHEIIKEEISSKLNRKSKVSRSDNNLSRLPKKVSLPNQGSDSELAEKIENDNMDESAAEKDAESIDNLPDNDQKQQRDSKRYSDNRRERLKKVRAGSDNQEVQEILSRNDDISKSVDRLNRLSLIHKSSRSKMKQPGSDDSIKKQSL